MRFTENFVVATSKISPCFCWPININDSLIQICIDKRRATTSMWQIEGIGIWNAKNDLSFNCSFQHPLDRAQCAHRTISMVYPLFWWWCFSCSSFVKLCIFVCVCCKFRFDGKYEASLQLFSIREINQQRRYIPKSTEVPRYDASN